MRNSVTIRMHACCEVGLYLYGVVITGALFCAFFVAGERGFYYWDHAFYHDQTLLVADAFRQSVSTALQFIYASRNDDYNNLFAVPLFPWVIFFGESRLAYVLAVYFVYFVPYLILLTMVARRLCLGRPEYAMRIAAVFALAVPACWYHVPQGYPDVGGAAMVAGCVVLYGGWVSRSWQAAPIVIGLIAGLSVVFRRHYLYAVLALLSGIFVDVTLQAIRTKDMYSLRHWLQTGTKLMLAGVMVSLTVGVCSPTFFSKLFLANSTFAPWEQSTPETLMSIIATVGAAPLFMATVGVGWSVWVGRFDTPELRLLMYATLIWTALWAIQARQQPYHYPHWIPLFVVLGLTALWLRLGEMKAWHLGWWMRGIIVVVIAVALEMGVPLTARMQFLRTNPVRLFPDAAYRVVNPAFEEIADLVRYLRLMAKPGEEVLVAASSRVLNPDLLRHAEATLYGRKAARLTIPHSPQVDSEPRIPWTELQEAQFVIIATPFQYHLKPESQKVVQVLLLPFLEQWPVSKDFELLPKRFALPQPGGEIRVYRRLRPASLETSVDTARRMEAFVKGTGADGPLWVVHTSLFPTKVVYNPDRSFRITAHPARASQEGQTRLALSGFSGDRLQISGKLQFYDSRCRGAELIAVMGADSLHQEVSLGVFSPATAKDSIDATLKKVIGRPVFLEIRSSPKNRDNVDFCTVSLNNLRVRAVP